MNVNAMGRLGTKAVLSRKGFGGDLDCNDVSLPSHMKTDFLHPHLQTGTEGFVPTSPERGLPETGECAALVPFPSPW